jgi:hypothetical protein
MRVIYVDETGFFEAQLCPTEQFDKHTPSELTVSTTHKAKATYPVKFLLYEYMT